MGVVSRVLRIQRGEGRVTTLVVGLMGVSMAGIAVGDSGVSALFFDRIGTDALPLVYLLQGATTFGVMLALTGVLGRLGPRRAYLAAPLGLAALVVIERAIVVTGVDWIYPVLWITVAIATLVQGVSLWGVAGVVVDLRQAKRLFPIFGAGGILGSVLGGLLTRPLAPAIGAQNLLLVWAGALAAAFLLARMLLGGATQARRGRPSRRRTSAVRDMAGALAYVRRSGLLVWMTLAAMLFSILFFSLYLPFAGAATERFPDADELAGFFGLFWAALTAAAFVVSMLLTNRLFAWVGVAAAVIVLPLLYSAAFGILLFGSGFAILVALRFTVGTWLQGVASPGWETLANVVPEGRRDQVRAFLNGGPTQMGTVVAGVIALIGQDVLTARQFAAIGLVAAVVTIVATVGVRRSYTTALVDALRAGRPQVFERALERRTPVPLVLDADSTRALARSMRSPDLHERRLAFQLLADLPPEARPPEVLDGVRDPDPIVRLAATMCLDVQAADGRNALLSLLDDADPSVAAAAAARGLATMERDIAALRLQGLLADRDDRLRLAAAEQLALAPASAAASFGSALLSDPVPEVRAIALERVADAAPGRALEPALRALHDPDAVVRSAAGRVLGAADGRALEHVLDALVDPGTTDAAIEAIRRTEADGGRERIRSFVRTVAERAARDRELAAATPSDGEATTLLRDATLDRGRRLARSGLWAATILGPRRAEMETAIENLDGTPGQVANALETLESAGDAALVRPLLTLWEPVAAPDRNVDWLAAALDDEDELIHRCAELVRSRQGGTMERQITALSVMERVLFLRKVPLFADLAPVDLERVAGLAEDHGYADAEIIAAEGEAGEELHIVVEGTIRVIRDREGAEHELARRTTGDVVGEMSIVTQEPRMATLIAEGGVRTVTLGHREFESMLRERPSIALAVMRVLAHRIAEDSRSGDL